MFQKKCVENGCLGKKIAAGAFGRFVGAVKAAQPNQGTLQLLHFKVGVGGVCLHDGPEFLGKSQL